MKDKIKELIESLGLQEEFEYELRTVPQPMTQKLLELCIDNGKYDLLLYFPSEVWQESYVSKVKDHFQEMLEGYKYTPNKLPEVLYNSEEILREFIKTKPYLANLSNFKAKTWTQNNLKLLFELNGEENGNYAYIFKDKKELIPDIVKTGNFKLLKIYSPKDITEDIADVIVETIKKDKNLLKELTLYNDILLKRMIENQLYNPDAYYSNECWTEENKKLICKAYENGEIELTQKIKTIKGINKYLLTILIKKGKYKDLSLVDQEYWTDNDIKLFLEHLDEYFKEVVYLPTGINNNPEVLKYFIENGLSEKVRLFKEEAFTTENINAIFERIDEYKKANFCTVLFTSLKCLEKAVDSGKISYLQYFNPKELTEELEDKIVALYGKHPNEKVSYYFMTKKFVKKLLASNNLTTASNIYMGKLWDEELTEEYFRRLLTYSKDVTYTNYYLNGQYGVNNTLALNTYLKTKRYEGIKAFIYADERVWNEENFALYEQNIDEYYKMNIIPSIAFKKSSILDYMLRKEDTELIRLFNKIEWNDYQYTKYINLYYSNKIKNSNFIMFDDEKIKIPYRKYLFLGSKYTKYSFSSDYKDFENIIKKDLSEEKSIHNNYLKLIKDTNSFKVYLHLLALVDGDETKIDSLFDENGPKQEVKEELIFDKDYIDYCIKNNIEINFNNPTYKKYFEIVKKYPNILDNILITKDILNEYFNELGPKKELFEFLFNPNGAEVLEELNEEYNYLSPKRMYILKKYIRIEEQSIKEKFLSYCAEHEEEIKEDKIDDVYNVLKRIETSNSSEILRFKISLADQILQFDDPSEKLEEVEKIFIQNNLPNVGKIFLVFKTLYPDYSSFRGNTISPTLQVGNDFKKDTIIFSDLIRITLGSNNMDLNEYINSLVEGNKIYRLIKTNQKNIKDLSNEEQVILQDFLSYINVLYKNTLAGKKDKRKSKTDIIEEIEEVKRLLNPYESNEQELPDRIIYLFAHATGFDTVEELKKYQQNKLKERENFHKNISAKGSIKLQKNDLIKGIKSSRYLANILSNGSLCGEFLGDAAGSDATPLDTDLSLIADNFVSNEEAIKSTPSYGYGSTFLVLKNDSRFNLTRTNPEDGKPSNRKEHRPELFQTGFLGKNHYGIRTGFASSDIDYILTSENPKRICLDVALSGIYIPVVDMSGKVIFTYEDYQNIRKNMQGLSHFGLEKEYKVASNVGEDKNVRELSKKLENSRKDIKEKQAAIYKIITGIAEKYGYKLNKKLTKNLQPGTIECIDTGSTGRGTNVPNDADFDFIMRLDRELLSDEKKLNEFKLDLLKAFNKDSGIIGTGDFRLKDVEIDGISVPLDIDISFVVKTNDINYSTDMCIKDRLDTIKKLYPEKYDEVIANIILAKQILKENHCYKANRGEHPEGGLCGVGVENWILQNGGSFLEAAKDFIAKSYGKSFEEFKKEFSVYNYGENFLAQRKGWYVHDDYVADNMSESGYLKMQEALKEYIKSIELNKINYDEQSKENTEKQTLSY